MLRKLLSISVVLLMLPGSGWGDDESSKDVSDFITYYHRKPAPGRVPQMLDLVLKKKVLENPFAEIANANVICAHGFGHMARNNPKLIRLYESQFDTADPKGRKFLVEALRICGDETTLKKMADWARNPAYAKEKREIEAARSFLADPKRKLPRDRPALTPLDLDLNWADFLVRGEYPPIARILNALEQPSNLRELITKRLKAPFNGEVKRKDVLKGLGQLQLLKSGTKETLVPGDLELILLYDRKGRLKYGGLVLEAIAQDSFDLADKTLVQSIAVHGAASWSLQANLEQHPKLAELLKKNYQELPPRSQELVKRWLRIDQPKILLDKDARRLQGTWQAVSWVEDGDKTEPKVLTEMLKYVRWIFEEDELTTTKAFTFTTDDKVEVRGQGGSCLCTYRIDASKNPKVLVATSIDSFVGFTNQYIFKIEDDLLTACWKTKGEGLPKDFSVKKGTGWTVATFRKVPKLQKK